LPAPRPDRPRPRTIRSALLGHDLLHAERPPIRFGWIQRCNPVTQFPDSLAVERGLRSLGFLVVVDAFLTDTAACADLVLPPALMLECDDLVGSYGHHHLGLARRVVDPPAGVRTDLEISQLLARELGRGPILEGTAAERIDRMLAPLGLRRADLEGGTVKRPGEPAVAFAGRRFATPSGRARLLGELAPPPPEGGHAGAARSHPLHLLTVASVEHQTSQVPPEDQQGLPEIVVHPEAPGVAGRVSGAEALVRSASVPSAALRVRLRLDAKMRRDTALLVRGGWVRFGRGVNVLVGARESYNGGCAAFYDELARIE
jgi:anaerobic selenocysteine-containing dehydrogenase